ncbi:MAG: endopeptidase La [Lachnospiraceae bacterium]|nr:endopeptidase La [Lachnospiraceae bacterium]
MKDRIYMPAVPLRGMTVLPGMITHLDIRREKSAGALEKAMREDSLLFLITQRDIDTQEPSAADLFTYGTVAEVRNAARLPQNIMRVMVEGKYRARLEDLRDTGRYLAAAVVPDEIVQDQGMSGNEQEAMARVVRDFFNSYSMDNKKVGRELAKQISETTSLRRLLRLVSVNIELDWRKRQALLEADSFSGLYELLCMYLLNEAEISQIRNDLQQKVRERIDKNQKEYILREQMKAIREELGEDSPMNDADAYMERLKTIDADEAVTEKIRKEISRLRSLGSNSAEASVSRTYIETLLDMPWNKVSEDNEDLKRAKQILEEDHYGLEDVKERVLEFLAVRVLTRKGDSPILCLVGPPGTGKTSIARSVARALNKKYVRISLGGIRDEAEIRGHRRTYIGAMPGRIAAGIRTAGVSNPLMLLDEIDKVSSDYKGDTASALLEVLDSEQNCRFADHYIEIPIDLSQVLFIATANDMHTIPRPLLDRMEVIEVSSYTENEKLHIAREHLVAKQMEHHGLDKGQLTITPGALKLIISGYTREAGVRQLERKIGEICRKAAREILEDHKGCVRVLAGNVQHYLGRKKYTVDKADGSPQTGIVRGLAWTSVGGDTLQIEVNVMPGKGEIQLTGQLGDVMKESARTGISFIRSVAEKYSIDADFFAKHDIHIHIPEGAVPKDGPSAGITMATAIFSAVTDRPVRGDIAMTGEITLRGRVLPVGGLKEKLLAAKNAGIRTVLVPVENRPVIEELSSEITDGLSIIYVRSMEEVLKSALA